MRGQGGPAPKLGPKAKSVRWTIPDSRRFRLTIMDMTNIRFGLRQREWEGPIVLEFRLYSRHSKTVRYKCQLEKHAFDFYAPLFLLHGLRRC